MPRLNPRLRRLLLPSLPLLLLIVIVGVTLSRSNAGREPRSVTLTELAQLVRSGDVVTIRETDAGGQAATRSGETLSFYTGETALLKVLPRLGVTPEELARVTYGVAPPPPAWLELLPALLP